MPAEVELLGTVLEGNIDGRGFATEGACPGTLGAGWEELFDPGTWKSRITLAMFIIARNWSGSELEND